MTHTSSDVEEYVDLITGRPIEPWEAERLSEQLENREINEIVKRVSEAFRHELVAIMAPRRYAAIAQPRTNDAWQGMETAPAEGPLLLWAADYGPIVADKRGDDGTWWAGDWDYGIKALCWKPISPPDAALTSVAISPNEVD